MKEIKTANEVVKMEEFVEYYTKLYERYGLNEYGCGKYARVSVCEKMRCEGGDYWYEMYATCGIRTMGDFDVDDMLDASDEIKAAAKIVNKINERMKKVKVIR